jgi:predicted patatin/cPLA2 family phospholipase
LAAPLEAHAHPVPKLLFARARARTRPGEHSDGCKLGLAVEGGGMRGIVSAGMLCALEQLDLLQAFDAVYGTSSGAINSAFFVAGQTHYGIPLYWEDINNRKFIDYLRLFSKTPVLSLEFLLEHVMVRRKRLDWQAVVCSTIPLKPVATCLESLQTILLSGFRSRRELFDALRASASIPLITGRPAEIDRRRYIDGGMIEPLSFRAALEDGCTHVLVLPTLPEGKVRFRNPVLTEPLVTAALERLRPGLARLYRQRRETYLADYRQLTEATRQPQGRPYILAIRPHADEPEIHWFERRRDRLKAGARAGLQGAFQALLGQPRADLCPQSWTGN